MHGAGVRELCLGHHDGPGGAVLVEPDHGAGGGLPLPLRGEGRVDQGPAGALVPQHARPAARAEMVACKGVGYLRLSVL